MVSAGDAGRDNDGALGPGAAGEFARRVLLLQTCGAADAAREGREHREYGVDLRAAEFAKPGGLRRGEGRAADANADAGGSVREGPDSRELPGARVGV